MDVSLISPTSKRGLGWPWDNSSADFALYTSAVNETHRLSWLFNWELWIPDAMPTGLEFVPLVRTAAQAEMIDGFLTTLQQVKGRVGALMGFNEPEMGSQASLSVGDAVALWSRFVMPAKTKFGCRLGSPGISSAPEGKAWLQDFERQVGGWDAAGVSFVVVHWYGRDVEEMGRYLQDMHSTFGKPLWLNEFACSSLGGALGPPPTVDEVKSFLRTAIHMLDAMDFVERYAYFGAKSDVGDWVGSANDFTQPGSVGGAGGTNRHLSQVGNLYLDL